MQPQAVAGSLAAIKVSKSDEGKALRKDLKEKSKYMREKLRSLGFKVLKGDSPIISVPIGADLKTLMAGHFIFERGVYLNSVLYPAVSKGKGILRISLTALHSYDEINQLIDAFKALKQFFKDHKGKLSENSEYFKQIVKSNIKNSIKNAVGKFS